MTLPKETELRVREHLSRIQDEFKPGTRVLVVIDQQYLEEGAAFGELDPDRAVHIIRRVTAAPSSIEPPPIAVAVSFLRGRGIVIEPTDRQGVYLFDRIEMTTNDIIGAYERVKKG